MSSPTNALGKMMSGMAPSLVADTSRVYEGAMFRQLTATPPPKWRKSSLAIRQEVRTRSFVVFIPKAQDIGQTRVVGGDARLECSGASGPVSTPAGCCG